MYIFVFDIRNDRYLNISRFNRSGTARYGPVLNVYIETLFGLCVYN